MKNTFCALALLALSVLTANATICLISPISTAAPQMITNIYGCRFHPLQHKWLQHKGVDFRAYKGTPLVAAQEGYIQRRFSEAGGQEVRVVGRTETMLRYLHLSHAAVDPGAHVTIGQEIARSGNTGKVTAAHLHFEVVKGRGDKKSSINVDPEPLLCKKIEHKLGAEGTDRYPIHAPVNGVCNDKLSVKSASFASLHASNLFTMFTLPLTKWALSAVDTADTATSVAPTVEQFDDLSSIEILTSEVLKRFANPEWHAEQAERGIVPLLTEYVQMKALENFLNLYKQQVQERIETLLAIRLARQNRRDTEELSLQQRKSAAYAASY